MSRLIDLSADPLPDELKVRVGDVLRFAAAGVRISGTGVELAGIHTEAVLGIEGTVLTPEGAPNVVLVRAVTPGEARLHLGFDPWRPDPGRSVTVQVTA